MRTIQEIREQIDLLDEQIQELYARRIDCVKEISDVKKQNQVQVCDNNRESEILVRAGQNRYPEQMRELMQFILVESKKMQEAERKE